MKDNSNYFLGHIWVVRFTATTAERAAAFTLRMLFDTIKTRFYTLRRLSNGFLPIKGIWDYFIKIVKNKCDKNKNIQWCLLYQWISLFLKALRDNFHFIIAIRMKS